MDFLATILKEKKKEVALLMPEKKKPLRKTYSFYHYVKEHPDNVQLIGEVKRASPSKGNINLTIDVVAQAKAYEAAGVAAISVLTDAYFFKGSIEDLQKVAQEVTIPILCKDFIIDQKQLVRARNAGATMVLLIVSALDQEKLQQLYNEALALDLEVLVEVHNQEELAIAHALTAKLIGINNRNLKTFDVSIKTSQDLAYHHIPQTVYISESGFKTSDQVSLIKENYQAILVGESLMRAGDPVKQVKELQVLR